MILVKLPSFVQVQFKPMPDFWSNDVCWQWFLIHASVAFDLPDLPNYHYSNDMPPTIQNLIVAWKALSQQDLWCYKCDKWALWRDSPLYQYSHPTPNLLRFNTRSKSMCNIFKTSICALHREHHVSGWACPANGNLQWFFGGILYITCNRKQFLHNKSVILP